MLKLMYIFGGKFNRGGGGGAKGKEEKVFGEDIYLAKCVI